MKFALSIKLQLLFNFIINIMLKLVIYINGLLLAYKQWGVSVNQDVPVSFPVTFTQSCYTINCNGSGWNSSGGATSAGISIKSLTLESFVISTWEKAPYRWFALGM